MLVLYILIYLIKKGTETVTQKLMELKPSINIKGYFNLLKIDFYTYQYCIQWQKLSPKRDCTMDTKCAPSYASNFMG